MKGACETARVSWDEAWGVMSRAVARGQARKEARPITYIGVDEKAFRKGHRYHTIVCDLARSTVEFVAKDRKKESLGAYYAQLTAAQKAAPHAVAMDMWEPYIGATRAGLPDGDTKIVFDRFHIMRMASPKDSTARSWASSERLAASAIHRTSRPRSISTAEALIYTHAKPGWFNKQREPERSEPIAPRGFRGP